MATYPVTYWPPGYYAPPVQRSRTPDGIKWTVLGFWLYLGYLAASALLALVAFLAVASLTSTSTPSLGQVVAVLAELFLAAIVGVVLGILVLVFYFMGFGYLYGGRSEFGPAHARNLRLALYLVIAAVVGYVAIGAVVFVLSFSLGFSGPSFDVARLFVTTAVSAILGVFVAALVAAVLVLSVRALARPEHQKLLYAAAALGTATPGIVGALALLQLARLVEILQALQNGQGGFFGSSIDPGLGIPTLVGGVLGLVTFILYLVAYRDIGARLRAGELKPVLPPPTPYVPWMPAPAGPPYPVPTQPAAPPPQPVPQGPAP